MAHYSRLGRGLELPTAEEAMAIELHVSISVSTATVNSALPAVFKS